MTPAQYQQQMLQQRAAYLAAAVKRSQELPTQAYVSGGTNLFRFPKAGVGRYAKVSFVGTLSRTEGATVGTVTPSPYYPFNLVDKAVLNDYTGTTRVNAKPYHLFLRQIGQKFGWDPSVSPENTGFQSTVWADSIPVGTASTTTTSPIAFSFEVPIALHRNTTEGSLAFAVPDGEVTLQLGMSTLEGNTIDSPFTVSGGSAMSVTGTWYVTYYYFDAVSGVALPTLDFNIIHELVSVRQTDNITAGQDKQFLLETGRTYYQLIQNFVANNAPDTVDVTRLKFLIDGNTPTMDEYLISYLARAREVFGRDMPAGAFYFSFWDKPWNPSSYGSLATSMGLSSTINLGTVYYLDVLKESEYYAQSALAVSQ